MSPNTPWLDMLEFSEKKKKKRIKYKKQHIAYLGKAKGIKKSPELRKTSKKHIQKSLESH